MRIPWTKLLIYGIVAGIVGVIPGLSIGTMMVVLNLYQQTIHSVSSLRKEPRASLRFLVPFVVGGGLGVFGFSHFITFAMEFSPMITQFFFIGLLLGSLPMLYRRTAGGSGLRWSHVLAFALALSVMLITTFALPDTQEDIIRSLDLAGMVKMAVAGFFASISMIIPGISGSFVMMVLGCYTTVLWAVSTLQMGILFPLAIGCLLGLLVGAKVIDLLLQRFPTLTYAAILGLVFGSVATIYPGFALTLEGAAAILTLVLGTWLALWFSSPDRAPISRHRTGQMHPFK